MTTEGIDVFRGANYEIAEAIAPTPERRRADVSADLQDSFARFAAADGFELPCVALRAVGRCPR